MSTYGSGLRRNGEQLNDSGAFPECLSSMRVNTSITATVRSAELIPTTSYAHPSETKDEVRVKPSVPATLLRDKIVMNKQKQQARQEVEDALRSKIAFGSAPTFRDVSENTHYIKYEPTGMQERVIRIQQVQQDPLKPPSFRLKKAPRCATSSAAPVLHSPPRQISDEDKANWNIPPAISNWKNSKGYTIPLDKRLAADGRGLIDVKINDNFAKFSEALYVAEQTARVSVDTRARIQKQISQRGQSAHEDRIRKVATQTIEHGLDGDDGDENDIRSKQSMRSQKRSRS